MNAQNVYTVKDIKSGLFAQPHFLPSDGVAIRSFAAACEDSNTELNKYPSDFSLYHIGTYDIEKGHIQPCQPRQIANAAEFVGTPATNEDIKLMAEKAREEMDSVSQ